SEPVRKPTRRPGPVVRLLKQHPVRLAAAIAAGIAAGAWTHFGLSTLRVYTPSLSEFVASQDAPIDVILAQARRLLDDGAYTAAVSMLDHALSQARPSPERSDAEYLRAEALYKAFSGDVYS